jgi:hypothetical protein
VTTWQISVAEEMQTYSPVGLRLLDELTDDAPLGKTTAYLDIRDASGVWRQTDIPAVRTPSGVVSYPGLERHADVAGLLPRHYRVRISADFYVPLYQSTSDGIEFDAYPFNDANPPQVIVRLPQDAFLTPAPNYPFQGHIPVLRGIVIDPAKNPVPNALVTQGPIERVVTDSRGTFALPLRWAAQNVPIPIDAVDNRTHRLGSIPVTLPGDLATSHTIPIS